MVRPASVDSNGTKKGAWSEEEDDQLRAYIQRYGHWNWRLLPKYAGLSRCGKSCRLRWVNYLKPGVKRGNFTKEEEDLVIQLHAQLGNKWSAIATKLAGRTDNEVKNFWHTRVENKNKNRKPHNQSRADKNIVIRSKDDQELQDQHTETINDEPTFDNTNRFTQPGLADSWPGSFPVDTPYNENDYNYTAPLIMPEEYFYFSEYNYSGSDSSHLSSSAQPDFWNIDASNASSSHSDQNTYNDIPSGGMDGVYDPLFDYFDHGINLFS